MKAPKVRSCSVTIERRNGGGCSQVTVSGDSVYLESTTGRVSLPLDEFRDMVALLVALGVVGPERAS